jgi:chromosome segregation ATPase
MFRAEAVFRNQCRKERDEALEKMNESVKRTQFLERQCQDLKSELERKERLSLQAIAARSSMKSHLDNATQHLKDTENRVKSMMSRIKEAEEEVAYYKKRHDEMFASVSALNKRIEELESHKLHLLDKLKGYGDKGGLEYIVKTQKLDQLKGTELQDRVVVEDYRPELNRSKHLAESSVEGGASLNNPS